MGMDVMGKNPTSERGAYFRNNVWSWHPLWSYCETMHGKIAGKVKYGHSNDGDGLNAEDAAKLGQALLEDIADGTAQGYEQDYYAHLASLPFQDCNWCGATGIRTDDIGVSMGMPTAELPEEVAIIVGRTHGTCNGCRGAGQVESWEASYVFGVDNLREFAEFLIDCGGFEIC